MVVVRLGASVGVEFPLGAVAVGVTEPVAELGEPLLVKERGVTVHDEVVWLSATQ